MRDIVAQYPTLLPLFALVLFFSMALLIAFLVLTDRRKSHLKRMESLPLDDAERHDG